MLLFPAYAGRQSQLSVHVVQDWNGRYLPILVQGHKQMVWLDQMAKLVHLACFAIRSVPYFEDVDLKQTGQLSKQKGNPRQLGTQQRFLSG